jgi:hypothetical protein
MAGFARRSVNRTGRRAVVRGVAALVVGSTLLAARPADRWSALRLIPFSAKRGEYLGGQRLGLWPAERRAVSDPAYANPVGFFEVTPQTRATSLSPHFTLGDFAMRAETGVGYVVVREELVDKLELVLGDLAIRGVRARDFRVLSGFRSPRHNAAVEGSAQGSRHQFGDAADLIVDDDGDGRMDDLNGDFSIDLADARVVAAAVERVELTHPDLAGGLGVYAERGPSGPFLHVDVRGRSARWGATQPLARGPGTARSTVREAPPQPRSGQCMATGASAVLCATQRELYRGRR